MKLPALEIARRLPLALEHRGIHLQSLLRYEFDFDVFLPKYGKNLQRGLVWSDEKKGKLIESLIRGFEIPPLCLILIENGTTLGKFLVIDGKQRLSTIHQFFSNKLSVSFEFVVNGEKFGFSGTFKDLPENYQTYIKGRHLNTLQGEDKLDKNGNPIPIPCDDLIELFSILNYGGEPLDLDHIQKLKK